MKSRHGKKKRLTAAVVLLGILVIGWAVISYAAEDEYKVHYNITNYLGGGTCDKIYYQSQIDNGDDAGQWNDDLRIGEYLADRYGEYHTIIDYKASVPKADTVTSNYYDCVGVTPYVRIGAVSREGYILKGWEVSGDKGWHTDYGKNGIRVEIGAYTEEDIVIKAVGLGKKGYIKPFDLVIHKGEVVGFTGLLGSGRSETVRVLYGAERPDEGTLQVKGNGITAKHPITSMHAGMAYLPEDRKNEGIIADLSVRENMIMALQAKRGMFKLMSRKEQEELTDKYIKMLQVKTASRETPIKSLSGGNQQKAIIAREVEQDSSLMIFVQPTRGLDIGAIENIHKQIIAERDKGKAILLISLELDEIMNCADTIAVIYNGSIQKIAKASELTTNEVGEFMMGVKNKEKEA